MMILTAIDEEVIWTTVVREEITDSRLVLDVSLLFRKERILLSANLRHGLLPFEPTFEEARIESY